VTQADIERNVRIVLYAVAGWMVGHGYGTAAGWEPWIGGAALALNYLWTLYGNRLAAKLKALADTGEVTHIVVADPAIADAVPSKIVVASDDVKLTKK
jgi:hypothetical protein